MQLILEKELPNLDILKLTVIFSNGITLPMKVRVTTHEVMEDRFNLYSFQIIVMSDNDKELLYQLINKNYFADLLKLWWKDVE